MRLDFEKYLQDNGLIEKFLADNGLKVGDKVRINHRVYNIVKRSDNKIVLDHEALVLELSTLAVCDFEKFEKVEPKKKVGDLICGEIDCDNCPLHCFSCNCYTYYTLRTNFEAILKEYPQLEPIKEHFEKELDKEVEEDD